MNLEIRAAASPGEIQVAVLRGGVLDGYEIWRPAAPDGVGDIHRGRVVRVVPAMAGAFVVLDGTEGFLPDSEGGKGLTTGTLLTVRVTRAAQGGKGPRLTTRDTPSASGPVGLVARGPDPLTRAAAAHPDATILVDDMAMLAELRPRVGERARYAAPAFDDPLLGEIETLASPIVSLPDGARLSFHPTPALIAIDVDAGAAAAEAATPAGGRQSRHLAINRAVLPALARQIRLRNLGGAIVIDLAGLPIRRRAALSPALTEALAADPLRPRFLGFSGLGLAEVLRPRVHPPLHEMLSGPHAAGLAALRAMATTAAADPGRRLRLRAAPAVAAALQDDRIALADLARRTGRGLSLWSDPTLSGDTWRLEPEDD